ncbi:unnamed protein product [Rhizophagus irregularis]|uniref:Uncharacterized protein n=1 Tax=Rhizophagus irregularis TaxID=588596 RepID=A0A2I1F7C8_9GLOM|nr:hypothetical protein RhiirB3_392449 [Rhizophagus irregularis]CAB4488327.1 unnamed protein product [Rhizophagus irregularis]CAB5347275.1 unnamed protein product [Rhizophagus irregularis]
MKPLNHFIIISIILSLFSYVGLAKYVNCPNADKNCYYLNELLAPCNHKIDFSSIYYSVSVGVDANFGFDIDCVCTKEFYDTLVTCGQLCKYPVDPPVKYESECKIAKKPVDLGGLWRK